MFSWMNEGQSPFTELNKTENALSDIRPRFKLSSKITTQSHFYDRKNYFANELWKNGWKVLSVSRMILQFLEPNDFNFLTNISSFSHICKNMWWSVFFTLFQTSFLKGTAELYNIHTKNCSLFCNVASLPFLPFLMKDDKALLLNENFIDTSFLFLLKYKSWLQQDTEVNYKALFCSFFDLSAKLSFCSQNCIKCSSNKWKMEKKLNWPGICKLEYQVEKSRKAWGK